MASSSLDLMVTMSWGLTLQICLITALSFSCRRWRFGFVNGQVSHWHGALCSSHSHVLKGRWKEESTGSSSLSFFQAIKKTCLYNFDPLKPHFYTVKLGFAGVYIIFLISAQNIDCGYSLEPPRRGGSNEYPQSMFWAEIWKNLELFIWKLSFFWLYLNRHVLVMQFSHIFTITKISVSQRYTKGRLLCSILCMDQLLDLKSICLFRVQI